MNETRYSSFCRVQRHNSAKFFCNGIDDYYSELYEKLENAKSRIWITDWCFNPEIYLKRPVEDYYDSR